MQKINEHIIHSRRERRMKKHRTAEVIDFRYESTAVPTGCMGNVYFC